jgi:hypothetical protein
MGSSQFWIDSAVSLIGASRRAGEAVFIGGAAKEVLRRHPDCDLTERELSGVILKLVIEQRWSFGS